MRWNYRVVCDDKNQLTIREAYYTDCEQIYAISGPQAPHSEDYDADLGEASNPERALAYLRQDLEKMGAALNKPVLIESEIEFASAV